MPGGTSRGGARSRGHLRLVGADEGPVRLDAEGADGPADDGAGPPPDPQEVARLICLRLLTAAPRTKAELAAALRRRRVPPQAAAAVLERFAEVGLIDDATFASSWVESRHYGRGLGRRALTSELTRRGVDRSDIAAAVDRLTPEAELATARALVDRKLPSTAGLPAHARIRRLAGMLARKGYPAGIAYRAVREALEESGDRYAAAGMQDDESFDTAPFDTGSFGGESYDTGSFDSESSLSDGPLNDQLADGEFD